MTAAVQLRNLRKVYDGSPPITALDGITLDMAAGTIYGLLGPNGAGKTTAIGICTTKVRATGGTATVAGLDVAHDAVAVRRHVGVASQAITLDRSCTVGREPLLSLPLLRAHRRRFARPRRRCCSSAF